MSFYHLACRIGYLPSGTRRRPQPHKMHFEYGYISKEVADEVSLAKKEGRRVICVGTTSVRLVEYAAGISKNAPLDPFEGWVNLFILPGYKFLIPDAMITNFHLPKSTLLMLVSAFGGMELMKKAYQEAIEQNYRFYSFGDAVDFVVCLPPSRY